VVEYQEIFATLSIFKNISTKLTNLDTANPAQVEFFARAASLVGKRVRGWCFVAIATGYRDFDVKFVFSIIKLAKFNVKFTRKAIFKKMTLQKLLITFERNEIEHFQCRIRDLHALIRTNPRFSFF
jgi:hypothetical protein